ncbi:MAG: nucleotidyltransferase domain-containing protein [Negativicoccus succinicivorans]|nr:nucleotidyltransferase domain-containing protein [Negativicoccus succinicivorans]
MRTLSLSEIKERIIPVCEKYDIPEVYIFGSYADGTARPDSDVDLIIDSTNVKGYLHLIQIINSMEEQLGKKVDIVTLNALRKNANKIFSQEVSKSAKPIFKKEEDCAGKAFDDARHVHEPDRP